MGTTKVIPFQATPRTIFSPEGEKVGSGHGAPDEVIFENLVWLNSEEAATYLRKSVGALRVLVCRGRIRARRFHRRLYFRRSELDRLIEGSERKGEFDYGN